MKKRYWKTLAASTAVAWALVGCGGGGGGGGGGSDPTPPAATATTMSGTVAAGPVSNADIRVYDATKYVTGGLNTALVTATSGTGGAYLLTLPVGFSGPLLVQAQGKADGSTTVKDEVFGTTNVTSAFLLESVVPASVVAAGGTITVHVTTYTQAMATFVSRKLGRSDVDAAIALARTQVAQQLTGGADPLTATVTTAKMTTLLGAASNIATVATSTALNDPYSCATAATTEAKIICTIKTTSAILQPLEAAAATTGAPTVNYNPASALAKAAASLDVATVATNTGVEATALTAAKTEVATQLENTKTAAGGETSLAGWDKINLAPRVLGRYEIAGSVTIMTGPNAGTYTGARLYLCLSYSTNDCQTFGPVITITPQEAMADREAVPEARAVLAELQERIGALLGSLNKAGKYPDRATLNDVVTAGINAGLAAESVDVAMNQITAGLAAKGFTTGSTAAAGDDASNVSAAQITAAQACMNSSNYQNPPQDVYSAQLDKFCQLAQFDKCLHDATNQTTYDFEGRKACSTLTELTRQLTGNWSCRYCPYPH